MNDAQLRQYLSGALGSKDVRKSIAAIERLRSAIRLLEDLPPPALDVISEWVGNRCKSRRGTEKEFCQAYRKLIEDELDVKKRLARDLSRGLTGDYDNPR